MSEKLTNSSAPPAPPAPPPRPAASPPKQSRRRFLTVIAVVGGLLALAPWVPFGSYLSASVGGAAAATKNETIVLDNNTSENKTAAGKTVNVNDLTTFPANSHWVMTYPSSGDPNLDGQNPNTFVKFELIRLPTELGGSNKDASAFVAFSKVCVHLWCSPNYNPSPSHELYECRILDRSGRQGRRRRHARARLGAAGPYQRHPAPNPRDRHIGQPSGRPARLGHRPQRRDRVRQEPRHWGLRRRVQPSVELVICELVNL